MKSPARQLSFKAPGKKTRKQRMADFKESAKDLDIRWSSLVNRPLYDRQDC